MCGSALPVRQMLEKPDLGTGLMGPCGSAENFTYLLTLRKLIIDEDFDAILLT